jgi:LmbE family N-acetylglucosaminyl deacetylase
MLKLTFGNSSRPPSRVLAVGAHADDIEIGCGGTLLRLVETLPDVEVLWVVMSAAGERAAEAQGSANEFLRASLRNRFVVGGFRDGFLPAQWAEIKECFEQLKKTFNPDVIFTHYRGDLHQDHRLVSELTWNTFRDHLILEYEIPKYDGDLGTPNLFVQLDEATCREKVAMLFRHFPSQHGRHWFTEDLFLSVLRLRGMESGSDSRYAEAFYCRKVVV